MIDHEMLTQKALASLERRAMFKRAGTGLASAAALAALSGTAFTPGSARAATTAQAPTAAPTQLDANILTFALNLEYLEATFYLNALTGTGLAAADTAAINAGGAAGAAGAAQVAPGGSLVPFQTPIIRQFAQTIAADEQAHVRFLRAGLAAAGTPVIAAPVIDVTAAGAFTTLAVAAGYIQPGQVFNPYRDENSFLLGAYIFEDVGVTAYGGAAALISQGSALVQYAASILAVEAYHAGTIRTLLAIRGGGAATDGVSNLRSMLSSGAAPGTANGDDFGTLDPVSGNVVLAPLDPNALTYRRSVAQVLNIVYGNAGGKPGLFFPNGLNQIAGQTGFA